MMTIYVGNLLFQTTEEELNSLFSQYGTVNNVKLIKDRVTGKPSGFGFVEMEEEAGNQAIEALNGVEYSGRNLRVNEARERSNDGGSRERRYEPRGERRRYD